MAETILEGLDSKAQDELAAAAEKAAAEGPSTMDKIIAAREERERLARLEAKTQPGAETLVSKGILLDPREAKAHPANKGFKLRWVNTTLAEKVQARMLEGYEKVPAAEGGKTLGNEYVLMRIPEEKADAKRRALKEKGRVWLAAHKNDMQRQAAEVAKILQEQYGFGAKEAQILIDEA